MSSFTSPSWTNLQPPHIWDLFTIAQCVKKQCAVSRSGNEFQKGVAPSEKAVFNSVFNKCR